MKNILPIFSLLIGALSLSAQEKPNLILIVADDLARNLCTFLPEGEGQSLMPTLDRLAEQGTVLNNMHSPSPVCVPSRFAILSGKFASRCRTEEFLAQTRREGQAMVGFNTHLIPGEETLVTQLRKQGYTTAAFGKNHVIDTPDFKRVPYLADPNDPEIKAQLEANADIVQKAFLASGFDVADRLYPGNPDSDGVKALAVHNQDWITEGVLNFITDHSEKPFFVYMATTTPHGPFEPERSWKGDPRIIPTGWLAEEAIPRVQAPRDTIDTRLKKAGITSWNAGQVLWLDDAVTAIMDHLESLNLADNTIVVVLSDHNTGSKGGAYEGGTRTAALVWRKGGFSGAKVIDAGLQLTDLAPTLLEWAGAEKTPDHIDGKSFAPVLSGEKESLHDELYFEMGYSRAIVHDGFKYLAVRYPKEAINMSLERRREILETNNAILRDRGRPIPTEDPMAPFSHLFLIPGGHDADSMAIQNQPAFFDKDQLYDLTNDPKEQNNLINDPALADRLADLKKRLAARVKKMPGGFGEFAMMPDQ
jgi:arylsulfatase A-like enzyme